VGRVPRLLRYYERLRLLAHPPARSVSFARRYLVRASCSCSSTAPARSTRGSRRPRVCCAESPFFRFSRGVIETSQVPGLPSHACPALRPRWCLGALDPGALLCCVPRLRPRLPPLRLPLRSSITRPAYSLSTLRGRPRGRARARLASGWWSTFAGRASPRGVPLDINEEFQW